MHDLGFDETTKMLVSPSVTVFPCLVVQPIQSPYMGVSSLSLDSEDRKSSEKFRVKGFPKLGMKKQMKSRKKF